MAVPVARAQIALPGAQPPSSIGQSSLPGTASRPLAPPVSRAPGADAVFGHQYQRNGRSGVFLLERGSARAPALTRLALVGYQISNPLEACRVEISGGRIDVRPAARHEGLESYDVAMEACPFSFDILEGALQVRGDICEIPAADCRVDPAGVWGPPGGSIGAEEAKTIETLRGRAETECLAAYRALAGLATANPKKMRDLAHDQAAFSSRREEICRDYLGEERHGFCASRITQARAVGLSALMPGAGAGKPAAPRSPRPKPATAPPLGLPGGLQ